MSSTKSRDGPRGGGGGGGQIKPASKSTSNNKTDLKTDKLDLNPKMMPTAEQMQIARIIDTHRQEDPELQKKIRQVMDITRTTEDEACKALHSREYDIEQAITLLVEGDSQSEWEEARRKKKVKTPGQKAEAKERAAVAKDGVSERSGGSIRDRESRTERPDRERKDSEYQDGSGSYDSRGRGNSRGFRGSRGARGGRGGGYRMDNKENDESNGGPRSGNGFSGRYSNGPGRGSRGGRESGGRGRGGGARDRDRDGTRTFASRARGPREGDFAHHPIDVWENSQADAPTETLKVEKWDEFPSAEDWDNEEYTGSLAESKVFTPSTQATTTISASPLTDTNSVSGGMLTETSASDGGGHPNHIGTASDIMSLFENATGPGTGKAKTNLSSSFGPGDGMSGGGGSIHVGPGVVVAGQSIDLSLLLQKPAQNTSSTGTEAVSSGAHVHSHSHSQQPVSGGINSTLQLQQSYSTATQHGQVQVGNGQALPPRNKGPRPARGPPNMSKIPSSGVEMPDDSSVATLDVQFGGMEFGSSGSAFNSVTQQPQHQHNIQQAGGDMMYGSNIGGGQQSTQQNIDYTLTSSAAGDKDGQGKSGQVQSAPTSASPFQGQRNNQQQQLVSAESLSNSKTVPISPNIDTHHSHSSSGPKPTGGVIQQQQQQQQQSQQHSQQQQQGSYVNSTNTSGSAFVSYAAKGAPGFPPVSQNQAGSYGTMPQGLAYGSPASNPLILTQQPPPTYHNMSGMSTYGTQPIVAAGVQHNQVQSHTIPTQSLNQGVSSTAAYGVVPPNPYHNPHTIPGSATGYMYSSNQYTGGYGQGQKLQNSINTTTGQNVQQLQSGKDNGADGSNNTNTPSAASAQIGTAPNLTGGSTNTSSASSTPNSKMSGSGGGSGSGNSTNLGTSTTSTSSKINTTGAGAGVGAGSGMPPGMVLHPQYIVNQSGLPMYSFQAPMYGYDEQYIPRLPHPAMTSYYDPTGAAYTAGGVPGSGRNDGSSLQTYAPQGESRFARSDSSTASPVPSNLTGQATQPMYNPALQGYYYIGNNMIHPGAFPYGPPQMYPTTPMPTPTNQSSGAPHGALTNHQYQNKGMYGSSYVSYENAGQQIPNVTDFVSKQSYSTGTAGVGGGAGSNSGKGSAGSSVNNSQTTELNTSLYKGHPNKLTSYDKPASVGYTGTMYSNAMGQQGNTMAGVGGMGFGVYMPAQPVLQPPLLLQDGNNGQRQGGQSKPGKQQFGNQQYWGTN